VEHCIVTVAIDTPLDKYFDYKWKRTEAEEVPPTSGSLVVVPFAKKECVGIVVKVGEQTDVPPEKLKQVLAIRSHIAPFTSKWLDLCQFAASYYQRPLGEVTLPAIPKKLRLTNTVSLERALKKLATIDDKYDATPNATPQLNAAQQDAAQAIANTAGFNPYLLYGVTGSGKTEVYLNAAAQILARHQHDYRAQILIMVPEINLTPQLEANIRARFPNVMVATLHSGLAEGERLKHWLAAHLGYAKIILGTRLSVLASLPHLKLIIVDEEHDPSYKQQEGLRYSARDLAVWRAHQLGIPIVLGSATPSLESWQRAQTNRYHTLALQERAVKNAELPKVRIVDMERDRPANGLTSTLITALRQRLQQGEQSLLFLNRRGYAPVIACDSCGWVSNCVRCSAFMVLHKSDHRLRCHHCSFEQLIPKVCPTCGNIDIQPLGRGTQRIEEALHQLFPTARIMRIDADSTRLKGSAQAAFDRVHNGEVDILIGTQMVAKGHDFQNLTLVGILNPDTALFSQDYRSSERLFAQLMQVAGRAGRAARKEGGSPSEVLIQTRYPQHPLYAAVIAHNYDGFAELLLQERQQAGLPPFMYQALLRAEARELQMALEFLQAASACLEHDGVVINEPIPMAMTRVANVERGQLLIESGSRPALHAFLKQWIAMLREMKTRAKWTLEVDPLDI
jgi:primosomal protein N' (replication factor Y)